MNYIGPTTEKIDTCVRMMYTREVIICYKFQMFIYNDCLEKILLYLFGCNVYD